MLFSPNREGVCHFASAIFGVTVRRKACFHGGVAVPAISVAVSGSSAPPAVSVGDEAAVGDEGAGGGGGAVAYRNWACVCVCVVCVCMCVCMYVCVR